MDRNTFDYYVGEIIHLTHFMKARQWNNQGYDDVKEKRKNMIEMFYKAINTTKETRNEQGD